VRINRVPSAEPRAAIEPPTMVPMTDETHPIPVNAPTAVTVVDARGHGRFDWLAPIGLIVLLLGIWETVVRLVKTPPWLLPSPSAIARAIVVDRRLLIHHAGVTLTEVILGFALALLIGVLLAIGIDTSRFLERAIYPLVIASQTVPIPALAPLLLIWLGYGLTPKILVTALVAFFPIAVNTVDGLRATDREVIALLRSLGAGRWACFRLARFPSALPFLFSGAKIGVAISVIGAIFGELVGAKGGLGYLLIRSTAQFQTARVFAAVVLLSLIGIGLFAVVTLAERFLLPWRRWSTLA
jgi:putative hydroxymethylpyrimidine transport system permease protein